MKLTESHLRNLIKQELKKTLKEMNEFDKWLSDAAGRASNLMMEPSSDFDLNVDIALVDFLKYETEMGVEYSIDKLANELKTTNEKIVAAYNQGGDPFKPYKYWTKMQNNAIVRTQNPAKI